MRIALDATSEVGQRAGRVLLAERDLDYLGVWGTSTKRTSRSGPIKDVTGFDAFATDREDHLTHVLARASVAETPLVVWIADPPVAPGGATVPIVTGANLASSLSEALANHPLARSGDDDVVSHAWTAVGKPLTAGTATAFPEPVGTMWTDDHGDGRLVAYRNDEWAASTVIVDGPKGRRQVGVADHRLHLEALVLAAVTLIAAGGGYQRGIVPAGSRGSDLLDRLLAMELDVAAWRSST